MPYCPQSVFKLPKVWQVGVPSSWHVCPVGGPPHSWSISILCSSNKMFQAHCPRPATACSFQWGNDIRDQSLGTRRAHCCWSVFASWPFGGQNIHTLTHTNTRTLYENASARPYFRNRLMPKPRIPNDPHNFSHLLPVCSFSLSEKPGSPNNTFTPLLDVNV